MSELLRKFGRKIRVGMVGGGTDSVIGKTHRIAQGADGLLELVAGCLSVDPVIAKSSAEELLIAPERTYTDYHTMVEKEAKREDGVDLVVICTPPHVHKEPTTAFLRNGFHVFCEKPFAKDTNEAVEMAEVAEATEQLCVLNYCYTGYPLVREARTLVTSGEIGNIQLVEVEFAGGEPGVSVEEPDPKKRHWRFRTESMGNYAILGELGSHAHNLASYVTGSQVTQVSADMSTHAKGREVYDNAYISLRFANGARGRIWASFVALGREHGLTIRVMGDKGAIYWEQENPEVLWHFRLGKPTLKLTRGQDYLSPIAQRGSRIRPGHPEGYLMAFANIYKDIAYSIMGSKLKLSQRYDTELQRAQDGAYGMKLIEAAVESNTNNQAWIEASLSL